MADERVFLSYARMDVAYVQALHNRLTAEQVEVWWDRKQPPGCDWTEQLYTWVTRADAMLVIVSQHSIQSASVKNEVWVALQHKRRVIPVVLEDASGGLLMLIGSLQYIDGRDGRDPMPEILEALRGDASDRGGGQFNPYQTSQLFVSPPSALSLGDGLPPPAASAGRAQITIVLHGDVRGFDQCEQEGLRQLLAQLANISPEAIRVLQIESGSVRVTLELPESTARWLLSLYRRNKPLIALLDIQAIEDFRVLRPAPRVQVVPPQVQRRQPAIAWRRLVTPALAFAVLLLLAWGLVQRQQVVELLAEGANERAIAVAINGNDDVLEFPLDPTGIAPGAKGTVWVSTSESAMGLYAKKLPPLPAGKVYELWLRQDNQIIPIITFDVDQDGRTWHLFRSLQKLTLSESALAFVTLEPASGGDPNHLGPVYLQGQPEK